MPLSSNSVQMARGRDTSLSDDFNRPNGSPIGETHFGDSPWKNIGGGAWTTDGNGHAFASGSPLVTPPPIVVIPTDFSDIDTSLTISLTGGDCLYFRVSDASNWWRLRWAESTTSTVTGCQTCTGTSCQTCTQYSCGGTCCTACCTSVNPCTCCGSSGSSCGSCPSPAVVNHTCGDCQNAQLQFYGQCTYTDCDGCGTAGSCSCNCSSYSYSCNCVTTYYYTYTVFLEKCVGGTVTTAASAVIQNAGTGLLSGTAVLRITAQGAAITGYYNGTQQFSITDAAQQRATMHGIGRGPTTNNGSALSQFSLAFL